MSDKCQLFPGNLPVMSIYKEDAEVKGLIMKMPNEHLQRMKEKDQIL